MSVLVHIASSPGSGGPNNGIDKKPVTSPTSNAMIVSSLSSTHDVPNSAASITDADVDAPMPSDLAHPTSKGQGRLPGSYPLNPLQSPGLPGASLHSCFGLPYQDHNYGAPPPFTPPSTPPPPQSSTVTKVNGHIDIEDVSCHTTIVTSDVANSETGGLHHCEPEAEPLEESSPAGTGIDTGITRCICDFEHDDGYMICCDRCGVWQHVDCMGLDRDTIPDTYYCELCEPRKLDKHRAVVIQTKKRQFLKTLLDSSATETEDETPHGKRRKANKLGRKKKDKTDSGQNSLPTSKSHDATNHKRSRSNKHISSKKDDHIRPFKALSQNTTQSPKKLNSKKAMKTGSIGNDEHIKPSSSPIRMEWSPPTGVEKGVFSSVNAGSTYEEAEFNQYSIAVESLLATGKFNGHHGGVAGIQNVSLAQLQDQLCRVINITSDVKGLEVVENTLPGQPLVEYKGKVTLQDQFDKHHNFYNSYEPSVLFYSKFEGVDVCIDARSYGCDARFVRRSCAPNSEVRHFVEGADVHFYIISLVAITRGEEVTIPFDFDFNQCCYDVKCACSRLTCPVSKATNKTALNNRINSERQLKKKKLKRGSWSEKVTAQMKSPSRAESPPANPKSPILTKSAKRRKLSPLKMPPHFKSEPEVALPLIQKVNKEQHKTSPIKSEPDSAKLSSNPITPSVDRDKKLTREEKKMEAIMKAFERLEKREERRKEAISRIQSRDSHDEGDQDVADSLAPGKIRNRRDTSKSIKDDPSDDPESPSKGSGDKKRKGSSRRKSRGDSDGEKSLRRVSMSDSGIDVDDKKSVTEVKIEQPPEEADIQPAKSPDLTSAMKSFKVKKGKRKGRSLPASRRQSRASSSNTIPESVTATDEPCQLVASSSADLNTNASIATAPVTSDKSTFKFPKTKKHLLSEWFNERSHQDTSKPLTVQTATDSADSATCVVETGCCEEDEAADFVRCVPSPHTNSLSHLQRRNSLSVSGSNVAQRAIASATPIDHGLGSAKKRWLRQAMTEHEPSHLSPTDCVASCDNSNSSSPGGSPTDFVTPLKKRRLARESLSGENPLPPVTPSSSSGVSYDDSRLSNGLYNDTPYSILQCNGSREEFDAEEHPELNTQFLHPSATSSPSAAVESTVMRDSISELCDDSEPMSSQGFCVSEHPASSSCHSSVTSAQQLGCSSEVDSSHLLGSVADETVSSGGVLASNSNLCSVSDEPIMERISQRDDVSSHQNFMDSVCGSSDCSSKNKPSSSLGVDGLAGGCVDSTESPLQRPGSVGRGLCDSTQAASAVSSLSSCTSASNVLALSAVQDSSCSVSESSALGERDCTSSASSKDLTKSPRSMDISSSSLVAPSNGDLLNLGGSNSTLALCSGIVSATGDGLLVSSSAHREEGELDSSYSDTEETGVTCSWVEERENEAQAKKDESEKEEGEITDDDSEDEVPVPCAAPANQDSPSPGNEETASDTHAINEEIVESSSHTSSPHCLLSSNSPPGSSEISSSDGHSTAAVSIHDHPQQVFSGEVCGSLGVSNSPGSISNRNTKMATTCIPSGSLISEQFPITGGRLLRGLVSPPATASNSLNSVSESGTADETAVDSSSHGSISEEHCRMDPVSSSAGEVSDSSVSLSLSPSSATSNTMHSKKKVSLLEYRKRLKSLCSRDGLSSSSSSSSSQSEVPRTSTQSVIDRPPVSHTPTLAPLPIFGDILSSTSISSAVRTTGTVSDKGEQDVRWNASATLAERMREQTPLSLTERLRKEFGLDTSEADESVDDNTDEDVPPPPPPPPPPATSTHTNVRQNTQKYSPLPPPPIPPISLTAPTSQPLLHLPPQPPVPPSAPLLHQQQHGVRTHPQPHLSAGDDATAAATSTPINGSIPSLMSLPPPPHLPRRHLLPPPLPLCEDNPSPSSSSSLLLSSPHDSPKFTAPQSNPATSHSQNDSHIYVNGNVESSPANANAPAQTGEISSTAGDLFPPMPPPPVLRGAVGSHRLNYNLPPPSSSSFH